MHTSSPLGPLPVLTVLNALTYQMCIAHLDVEQCGATVPDELLGIGLDALIDTTGALAGRKHITGSFTAVTPERIVGVGSRGGHWRTAVLPEDHHVGPGVVAPTRALIDATSGRSNVGHLYRTGELHVRDLAGLVRLAPVLDGVPGSSPTGCRRSGHDRRRRGGRAVRPVPPLTNRGPPDSASVRRRALP